MSHPAFIHIMSNGDVWYSIDPNATPTGTVLAAYRVNTSAATQKLGTLTATAGAVTAASGGTGKYGKEIV